MKKKSLRPSLKVITPDEKINIKRQRPLHSEDGIVELMDSLDVAADDFALKAVYKKDLSSLIVSYPQMKEFTMEELLEKDKDELMLLLKESFTTLQDSYFRMQFYLDELVLSQQQQGHHQDSSDE